MNRLTRTLEPLVLIALFGAFGFFTLYPWPEPEPEPEVVIIADNELQEQICETVCEWIGDQWVCWTYCW